MTGPAIAAALDGARHLLLGYRLLFKPGVRGFMLIPLAGNALLYLLAAALAFYGLDAALDRWLPEALGWSRWLLFPLVGLLLMIVAFFTFTLVGNLVLAPFNGLLSQRVERALTGTATVPPAETVAQAMRRSLIQALRRLGYVLVRLTALFLLGLIPLVGVIALPLGVMLGAWLLALEFSDNPFGNWGWELAQQKALLRAHRPGFFAFGLGAMGLSLVPVLNFMLIPAAVAGMTAYCLELRRRDAAPA